MFLAVLFVTDPVLVHNVSHYGAPTVGVTATYATLETALVPLGEGVDPAFLCISINRFLVLVLCSTGQTI